MKVGILFSGGKDSSLALYESRKIHHIACLISLFSRNPESYMFHVPNIELTRMQAEAIGLPLIQWTTKGEKETELDDLAKALSSAKERFGVEGVVTGAIRSVYQASRIQLVCYQIGLWCFNPLWLKDQIELLNEIVEKGFRTIISGVFAFPLDRELLGKEIGYDTIGDLQHIAEQYLLNPAGEGGELETTVIDAPFFKKRIEILDYQVSYRGNSGVFEIRDARLIDK